MHSGSEETVEHRDTGMFEEVETCWFSLRLKHTVILLIKGDDILYFVDISHCQMSKQLTVIVELKVLCAHTGVCNN